MNQELETRKELSLEEANDRLTTALAKINENRVEPLVEGYIHRPFKVFSNVIAGASFVGGFVAMSSPLIFGSVSPLTAGLVVPLSMIMMSMMLFADEIGKPHQKFLNFLARKIITSKKSRLELETYQKALRESKESMELFLFYVNSVRADLEEEGVFEALNKNQQGYRHSITGNGKYEVTPVQEPVEISKDIRESNRKKTSSMMKELCESPRLNKKVTRELNK